MIRAPPQACQISFTDSPFSWVYKQDRPFGAYIFVNSIDNYKGLKNKSPPPQAPLIIFDDIVAAEA